MPPTVLCSTPFAQPTKRPTAKSALRFALLHTVHPIPITFIVANNNHHHHASHVHSLQIGVGMRLAFTSINFLTDFNKYQCTQVQPHRLIFTATPCRRTRHDARLVDDEGTTTRARGHSNERALHCTEQSELGTATGWN